ncbi:MAG: caspase family protein [Pseudorhodoplanes sp.]
MSFEISFRSISLSFLPSPFRRLLWSGAIVVAAFCATTDASLAAKRVALVVGNDDYAEVPKLNAAVNDARAIREALAKRGFDVVLVENGTKLQISRAISSVEGKIEPGDAVVFHFAGHGFELDGQNWLLPTDVPAAREGEASLVKDQSFNAADIIERLRAKGARTVVAVLDACRNNPFARTGTRALSGTRGLARMEPQGGVFILFSAGAKQEALDRLSPGDGEPVSVFARNFLPLLASADMTLIDLAKETQERVQAQARSVGHEQLPAYYDGVVGRITLTGDVVSPAASQTARVNPPAAPATAPVAQPAQQPRGQIEASLASSPQVEACDRAAASPNDPDKPASIPGVDVKAISGPAAIAACRAAAEIPNAPRRVFFELGRAYVKLGNDRDAVINYLKAAKMEHLVALHNLGVMHKTGKGITRDLSAAREFFGRAADAGFPASLHEIGNLYLEGAGAPRDYQKARFYFEKAVEAGVVMSYANLGNMYLYGRGVPINKTKACELYRQGSTLGDETASKNFRQACGFR